MTTVNTSADRPAESRQESRQDYPYIGVRCSDEEKQLISDEARLAGTTMSDFCREAALTRARSNRAERSRLEQHRADLIRWAALATDAQLERRENQLFDATLGYSDNRMLTDEQVIELEVVQAELKTRADAEAAGDGATAPLGKVA